MSDVSMFNMLESNIKTTQRVITFNFHYSIVLITGVRVSVESGVKFVF